MSEDSTFQDLHDAIQRACGWEDCHEFLFFQPASRGDQISVASRSDEDAENLYGRRLPLATELPLTDFFGEGKQQSCWYEYDFGDHWRHEVVLVKEVEHPEAFNRRLLWGERAFPPEDCGGLPGYERCLEFRETGEDPEEETETFSSSLSISFLSTPMSLRTLSNSSRSSWFSSSCRFVLSAASFDRCFAASSSLSILCRLLS